MKTRLPAAALVLTLSGCTAATPPATAPPPPPNPTVTCLPVSTEAQASLQRHLDAVATEQSILNIKAVESPNATPTDPAWFVAAEVDSQGTNVTAVWFTTNDPTVDDTNAYASVDTMAETISDYFRPEGFTAALEGAQQARACLN